MIAKVLVLAGVIFLFLFGAKAFRKEEKREQLIFPPLSDVDEIIIEKRLEDINAEKESKVLRTIEVDRLYEKLQRSRPQGWRKMIGNYYVVFKMNDGNKMRLKVNNEFVQGSESETAFSINNFQELCDF